MFGNIIGGWVLKGGWFCGGGIASLLGGGNGGLSDMGGGPTLPGSDKGKLNDDEDGTAHTP